MSDDQIWVVIGGLTLGACAAIVMWASHLWGRRRVAMREMVHRERLAALEKGQPLPEVPRGTAGAGGGPDAAAWMSRVALLAGLALLFAGIGFALAFGLTPDTPETRGMQELAPMGFLPAFTGIGLLLFYVLDRRSRRPPEG